ncbi:MAG: hypothetical protein ACXWBP_03150 [Limisphaerales bacterium]
MQCPSCSGSVTFPALPPGTAKHALRLERDRPKVKEPFRFDVGKILGSLISFSTNFQHWRIVAMCLLPFALIVVGLAAASLVRKQDTNTRPAESVPSATQAAESQRLAALNQADLIVQDRVKSVWKSKNVVDAAIRKRTALHQAYDGKQMSQSMRNAVDAQYKLAEEEIEAAQANLNGWRRAFDTSYENYKKYGGTIDYQSQLPR